MEAGFLSAFCTISKAPTFVVVQNGQLQEQLTSGISKEDFINRLRKILGASPIPGVTQAAAASPRPSPSPQPRSPEDTPTPSTTPAPSSKAKGKQKAVEPQPSSEASATKTAQQSAREALRKRKQEEKEELARIKARIEADKAERKADAEARKAERERLARSSPTATHFPPTTTSTRGSQAKEVHLNVRLFDGHTIRSTFPRTAKLQDDVRRWVDEEFAAKAENAHERHPPYIFKQILAPLPSRELSAGDEAMTLGDIDLAPSATLVLVPIKGYTEAYAGGAGGIVSSAAGGIFGLVGGAFNLASSAVGYVGSTLASALGGGDGTAGAAQQEPTERGSAGHVVGDAPRQQAGDSSGIRVRTLADQRAGEPRSQQLYNGNQVRISVDSPVR